MTTTALPLFGVSANASALDQIVDSCPLFHHIGVERSEPSGFSISGVASLDPSHLLPEVGFEATS